MNTLAFETLLADRLASRDLARLLVSPAAVMTLATAARLLPWSDHKARKWLRGAGVVRLLDGAEFVVWADVLAALPLPTTPDDRGARGTTKPKRPTFVRGGGL